ncbi:MAG: DUF3606 domain-containing protein [Pseudomonadota bacterium]|nr:DUF3606 domain-containing protein [Pseudomonadota bacterium]
MSETARGRSRDRSRINLHEAYEVRYWSQALGVTKEHLAEAVQNVGNSAEQVQEYFAQTRGA